MNRCMHLNMVATNPVQEMHTNLKVGTQKATSSCDYSSVVPAISSRDRLPIFVTKTGCRDQILVLATCHTNLNLFELEGHVMRTCCSKLWLSLCINCLRDLLEVLAAGTSHKLLVPCVRQH